MRIGRLDKRVKLLQTSYVTDGAGGQIPTTTEAKETWGRVTPMKGLRAFQYGQIVQGTWYDIQLRYRTDIEVKKDLLIEVEGKNIVLHNVIESKDLFTITGYERQ